MTVREHLEQVQEFLHSDFRRTVRLTTAMLIAAVAMGFLTGRSAPDEVEMVISAFMEMIQQAGVVMEDGEISVFSLLSNNWQAMMVAMFYGILPFVHLPSIVIVSNGLLVGMLGAWFQNQGGSMVAYAAGILPHGIFELAALVLAASCGSMVCRISTNRCLKRPQKEPDVNSFIRAMEVLLFAVAPLTVIAAFIETYITPVLLQQFM